MTEHVEVFGRLLLAATLGAASAAKFVTPSPASGAARRSRTGVVPLLATAEGVVAVALVPALTARWGAIGAVALALGFLAALGRDMARGVSGACHCFGALDPDLEPLVALFRASVLLALAALVTMLTWRAPAGSVIAWLAAADLAQRAAALGALALMAAALTVPGRLMLAATRWSVPGRAVTDHAGSRARSGFLPAGLPVGAAAPDWGTLTPLANAGDDPSLRFHGGPVLVLFHGAAVNGARSAERSCGQVRTIRVAVERAPEVAARYRIAAVPSGVLVAPDGVIASPVAIGAEAVGRLCARAAESASVQAPEPVRRPAASRVMLAGACAGCGS